MANQEKTFPPQQQSPPGEQNQMHPRPKSEDKTQPPSGKLNGKVALITGADSGIGRAVALLFAKEGADVAIVYLKEYSDAEETKQGVEKYGRKAILIAGDVGEEAFCKQAIQTAIKGFGRLDILINNAAEQHRQKSV
jgi:NAD(P)-dependent dehydrogenase (short-subunit alcohol dehydrogenase family)